MLAHILDRAEQIRLSLLPPSKYIPMEQGIHKVYLEAGKYTSRKLPERFPITRDRFFDEALHSSNQYHQKGLWLNNNTVRFNISTQLGGCMIWMFYVE